MSRRRGPRHGRPLLTILGEVGAIVQALFVIATFFKWDERPPNLGGVTDVFVGIGRFVASVDRAVHEWSGSLGFFGVVAITGGMLFILAFSAYVISDSAGPNRYRFRSFLFPIVVFITYVWLMWAALRTVAVVFAWILVCLAVAAAMMIGGFQGSNEREKRETEQEKREEARRQKREESTP